MPSHSVGFRRWISSSCNADGVDVPEPAQFTVMPREAAQRVLVEDRDLAPLVRIVESSEIDRLELRAPERRAPRLLDREALALSLDAPDLGARLRKLQWHESGTDHVFPRLRKTWSVPG